MVRARIAQIAFDQDQVRARTLSLLQPIERGHSERDLIPGVRQRVPDTPPARVVVVNVENARRSSHGRASGCLRNTHPTIVQC